MSLLVLAEVKTTVLEWGKKDKAKPQIYLRSTLSPMQPTKAVGKTRKVESADQFALEICSQCLNHFFVEPRLIPTRPKSGTED